MTVPRVPAAGIWVIAGALGGAVITVVGFRVIGEIVGAEVFGQVALLYGITLLIANLGAGPVAQALGKYYFDARDTVEQSRWFFSGAFLVLLGLFVGVGIFAVSAAFGWLPGGLACSLLVIALAMEMMRALGSAWLQSQTRFAAVAISQLTDAALRPIVVVLLVSTTMIPLNTVLLAYALAGTVSVGILAWCVLQGLSWVRPRRDEMRRILIFGTPLLGNSIFGWMSNAGDRYLVAAALDVRAAGVYVAASALGGRLSLLIGNTFETYFRPALYAAVSDRDRVALRKTCKTWATRLAIGGAVALLTLLITMQQIRELLLASEFRDGAGTVIGLSFMAYWIVAFGFIPQRINYALERTVYVAVTEVAGALLMGISVLALGSLFGLAGAAAGMVLAAAGRFLLASYFASRSLREAEKRLT